MRLKNFVFGMLLSFVMLGVGLFTSEGAQQDTPPRGRAYGIYMKDGGQFLIVYVEKDGSRYLQLSQCHQNWRYLISRSHDLINWTPMTEVQIGSDGTASTVDETPAPYCFYTVKRIK